MSLCWIMQSDFLHGTGRCDDETGEHGYSDEDLRYGIQYASDYLSTGTTREPLYGYDLRAFRTWCVRRLYKL